MVGLDLLKLLFLLYLTVPGHTLPVAIEAMPGAEEHLGRARRQATGRNWTLSGFSECSATCGGGLRARSVRCLDGDGIIRMDCSLSSKPESFELCSQVNCSTGDPSPVLPPSGTYNFSRLGDGKNATATLVFDNRGNRSFSADLTVVESDRTSTRVQRTVDSEMDTGETVMIIPASDVIVFPTSSDQTALTVNGEDVIDLNGVSRVTTSDGVLFQNNVVSLPDGNILADGVNTFIYYDGLKFYWFITSIRNPLGGPGNLYINPLTGTSLYSISSAFNSQFDNAVRSILNPSTTSPSTTQSTTLPPSNATPTSTTVVPSTSGMPDPFTTGSGSGIIDTTSTGDEITTELIPTTELVQTTRAISTTEDPTIMASTARPTDGATPTIASTGTPTDSRTTPPSTILPTTSELASLPTTDPSAEITEPSAETTEPSAETTEPSAETTERSAETTATETLVTTPNQPQTTESSLATPTEGKPTTTEMVKTRTRQKTKTRKGKRKFKTRTKDEDASFKQTRTSKRRSRTDVVNECSRKRSRRTGRARADQSRTGSTGSDRSRTSSTGKDQSRKGRTGTDRSRTDQSGTSRRPRTRTKCIITDRSRTSRSRTGHTNTRPPKTRKSGTGSSIVDQSRTRHSYTMKSKTDSFSKTLLKKTKNTSIKGVTKTALVIHVVPNSAVSPCPCHNTKHGAKSIPKFKPKTRKIKQKTRTTLSETRHLKKKEKGHKG